jgi:hypothetical protein
MEEGEICSAGNHSSIYPPPNKNSLDPESRKNQIDVLRRESIIHLSSSAEHVAMRRIDAWPFCQLKRFRRSRRSRNDPFGFVLSDAPSRFPILPSRDGCMNPEPFDDADPAHSTPQFNRQMNPKH